MAAMEATPVLPIRMSMRVRVRECMCVVAAYPNHGNCLFNRTDLRHDGDGRDVGLAEPHELQHDVLRLADLHGHMGHTDLSHGFVSFHRFIRSSSSMMYSAVPICTKGESPSPVLLRGS